MENENSALTKKEFSDKTGLSVTAIGKLLRLGQLEGYKKAGKWRIPAHQLQARVIRDASNDPLPPPAASSSTPPAESITDVEESTYSVQEFSQMTYLTEFGVMAWLKNGRLLGTRQPDGTWRVKASSLKLPRLQHLLRK